MSSVWMEIIEITSVMATFMAGNTSGQDMLTVHEHLISHLLQQFMSAGARCSSVVRAFAHGAMDRRIDPSWWTH